MKIIHLIPAIFLFLSISILAQTPVNRQKVDPKHSNTNKKNNKKEKAVEIIEKPNTAKNTEAPQAIYNQKGLDIPLKPSEYVVVTEFFDFMSQGKKAGLQVNIPAANTKTIEKSWKKELKNYKGKTKYKKEEYFTDNALLPAISENSIDIYSIIEATNTGVILKTFWDLGGAYIDEASQPDKFKKVQNLLGSFAIVESKKSIDSKLVEQEAELQILEKRRNELQEERTRLTESIAEHKRKAMEQEKELENLIEIINKANISTHQQITVVEQFKADKKTIEAQAK